MHWYTDVLKKYAVFDGRAARPEYWWFTLIYLIIYAVVVFVVVVVSGNVRAAQGAGDLYSLALLLPSIGVTIRRLHDTNRRGWWMLVGAIPIIGWVVLIVFLVEGGAPGPNRFGPDPQHAGAALSDAA